MRGTHYTVEQFLEAIRGSGGIVSRIASRVGCEWHTAKKWIDKHQTLQTAWNNERNSVDDMAESVIIKAIAEGNVDAAWKWLRARRRSEFGDSVDVTSKGKPIVILEWMTYAESNERAKSTDALAARKASGDSEE